MYRHVFICAFIVIVSGWCTLTFAENAEMSLARSMDIKAPCIDIEDCPTVYTDCQEKCGCVKTIPSTYDNGTNNCELDIQLLIMLLEADERELQNTEVAENGEMLSARTKIVNTTCIEIGDCAIVDKNCLKRCGCDKRIPFTYDNGTNNCEINTMLLIMSLKEKYNTQDKNMSTEDDVDDMASKLRAEADRIFKGIIVAGFLFIVCASLCTLAACIYCCRINYTDYQLKKSVKVLARKMGKKSQPKKPADKAPTAPMAESCNVVVEDAGVFCV